MNVRIFSSDDIDDNIFKYFQNKKYCMIFVGYIVCRRQVFVLPSQLV